MTIIDLSSMTNIAANLAPGRGLILNPNYTIYNTYVEDFNWPKR